MKSIKILTEDRNYWKNLCSELSDKSVELERELERLKDKERIYQIGDEWYRKKTEPIKHLWPLENSPGIGQIVEKLQSQLEENERLREMLEFYADSENYKVNVVDQWGPEIKVMMDGGAKAAELLEGLK